MEYDGMNGQIETQTFLNVILSCVTVYLAIRNFVLASRKNTQRESQELTEIRVQLTQVMGLLRDLQKDVRTSTADFRALSDRVLKIETQLEIAMKDLAKMKEDKNG